MERHTVSLRVAGQNYKVVSSAEPKALQRLAAVVDAKVTEITRGKGVNAQAVLLAAISLAHEVEEERAKREATERRTRDLLRRVLLRIDDALEDAAP